jgi:hypothetical protein
MLYSLVIRFEKISFVSSQLLIRQVFLASQALSVSKIPISKTYSELQLSTVQMFYKLRKVESESVFKDF